MIESKAIEELQLNIDLPFGGNISDEASKTAIQALENQIKIKEAFNKWKEDTSGFYGADYETIELINNLVKILEDNEEWD